MRKYGKHKALNHERVWQSALTIEYLAAKETGSDRKAGEDLLIQVARPDKPHVIVSIAYVALGRYKIDTWPELTTIDPEPGVCRDVLTLTPDDAVRQVFFPDRRHTFSGAEVVEAYARRMVGLERALRDPAIRHYVEFE